MVGLLADYQAGGYADLGGHHHRMEQFLEGSFPALVDGRGGAERCLDCRVVGAG